MNVLKRCKRSWEPRAIGMPRQVVVRTKECTEKVGRRLEGGPVHDDPQSAIHTVHTSLATRKGAGCQGKVRKERLDGAGRAGARKERSVEKEWKEWKKLASGAQRAGNDNKRGDGGQEAATTMEGVAKFGGQRISGRSKCVWLCCAWPDGSWLAALAGWPARKSPGFLRRQKLSGFRECGRCGTLLLEIPVNGHASPGLPWLPCRPSAATSMQGPILNAGTASSWLARLANGSSRGVSDTAGSGKIRGAPLCDT